MPLFELEEGPYHKFYRIDRVGTRLELHWGRIGTAGQKKTLELASESEAVHELEQEIFRRRERGYRQVVDESAPHDHEEARQRALAATGVLTKYPRFVFRKRDHVTWVEVRDETLVTATGDNGTVPTPVERACSSEHSALRERDRVMAELIGAGYALDEFGAAETPAAKRRAPKLGELRSHPELEAQLAAAPDDPSTWLVFEDWLLDQRDPRASLIEHERAGDVTSAAQARGALKKLLFGPRAATFEHAISSATWRAGFVRACSFDATGTRGGHRLAELLATPAARYLTELDVELADFAGLADLAGARLLRTLRAFPEYQGLHIVNAVLLEPLEHLVALRLEGLSHLEPAPCLARLRALSLSYSRDTELGELAGAPLHRVATLTLHAGDGVLRAADGEALVAALPALRELNIVVAKPGVERALETAIASGLVPRLRRFSLQTYTPSRTLTAGERAAFRSGVFAHLEHVELPAGLKR